MTQEMSDKLFFEGISSLGLKPAVLEAIVDIHKIVYSENSLNEGVGHAIGTLLKIGLLVSATGLALNGAANIHYDRAGGENSWSNAIGQNVGRITDMGSDAIKTVENWFGGASNSVEKMKNDAVKGYNKSNPGKTAQVKKTKVQKPQKPIQRTPGK